MTRRVRIVPLGFVLAGLLSALPAMAQQPPTMDELKKEMEALRESMKGIQKDLQEIKTLLQQRPQPQQAQGPQNVVLDIAGKPFKGESTAKLTLVEFTDYQ